MRKQVWTNNRHHPRRFRQGWRTYGLAIALLVLSLAATAKNSFWIDNGLGGTDWQMGQPQVTFWNSTQPRSLPELRNFALKLINRDRQVNGLPALVEDSLLSQAAQLHAEDMKARNFYDHVTPEGRTPTDRFAAIGGEGGVGENIMLQSHRLGQHSLLNWKLIEAFQKSWMYSDGHRANLLHPHHTRVGYGIVADPPSGRIYAVQKFQ
jgi:uncharacterized protein YkwD